MISRTDKPQQQTGQPADRIPDLTELGSTSHERTVILVGLGTARSTGFSKAAFETYWRDFNNMAVIFK